MVSNMEKVVTLINKAYYFKEFGNMVKETALEKWQMEIMYMNRIGMMKNLWEIKIEVRSGFDNFFCNERIKFTI